MRWPWNAEMESSPIQINLGGKCGARIIEGKAKFLAVVVYDFEASNLNFIFPNDLDKEEAMAIIKRFVVVPEQ